MSDVVISVENLSKSYHLGVINTGTFRGDLQSWWAWMRGLPDPHLKIGEADHGNVNGETLWALKDVSFEVRQGEAVGIIGRNGAGKSTLLKILSEVTAPTSGEVKIQGRIASLLEVGTGFHPELTGRENIYLNGAILGMKKAEITRKFDEIVDFSGVEQFIDTPVKRYSSGMYVRLAFAVAAHLEPEILVVDEVLAVGDAEFQKKCLGKMSDVAHEGRTVLFVSHNMGAVKSLCNRAMVLKGGGIFYEGDVNNAVEKYLDKRITKSSASIIIPDSYPRLGNGAIQLTKVELLDQSGMPATNICFGQSLQVSLGFEVKQKIREEVMAFIYIVAMGDTRFGVTYNIEQGMSGWQLKMGYYSAAIDMDTVLLPHHTYSFDIGFYNRRGTEVYDFVEQTIQFQISPDSAKGTDNYPGEQSHAFYRIPSRWHLPTENK